MRGPRSRLASMALCVGLVLAACTTDTTERDEAAATTTPTGTDGTETASATTATHEPTSAPASTADTTTNATSAPAASTAAPPPTSAAISATVDPVGPFAPLPPQPDDVAFPIERWPEGAIPDGVDVDQLAEVLDAAFDRADDPYGQIDAVLVVQGGQIVLERYDDSYPPAQPHDSWSVAKSMTHAVLGILERDGLLDYDGPAAIEEWSGADDARAAITPELLARMSSGLEWNEETDAFALVASAGSTDAAAQQAERPLASDVGEVFDYSTGSTAVNGRIIGDLVGTGDEFRSWIDAELFGPLGVASAELISDVNGYWVAGYGANMVARDFARFGLLYLRDGMWDGTRILPEGWVDDARTPSATTDAYGAGFWIGLNGNDTFSAEGFLGQKIVIVPDSDLVVVVLSDNLDSALSTDFASSVVELFRTS